MSYDVELNGEGACDIGNITWNVGPMFRSCLGGDGLNDLNGIVGQDALPRVLEGIRRMIVNRQEYEAMNPENGWGDYSGALHFLIDTAIGITQHPQWVIEVT